MKIEEEIQQQKFKSARQKAALNLIYSASWLLNQQQHFFKSFGITPSQYNILRILRGKYPDKLSGAEIKSRMLDRNSDIPRLLDRLLKKAWISKTPCAVDKRAADIAITKEGLQLLEQIDPEIDRMEKTSVHLNEAESKQLNQLLDKLRGS